MYSPGGSYSLAEGNVHSTANLPRITPYSVCTGLEHDVPVFRASVLNQCSEVPSLGTFSGTLSGKWAKVGKMGENGGK